MVLNLIIIYQCTERFEQKEEKRIKLQLPASTWSVSGDISVVMVVIKLFVSFCFNERPTLDLRKNAQVIGICDGDEA